jgi:hypothetical protein
MSVAPAIPRPGANEHAAYKPIRAVVAIRGARVRIIRVVAVWADRGACHVTWTNANADRDLGMRGRDKEEEHPEDGNEFEISHDWSPFSLREPHCNFNLLKANSMPKRALPAWGH